MILKLCHVELKCGIFLLNVKFGTIIIAANYRILNILCPLPPQEEVKKLF